MDEKIFTIRLMYYDIKVRYNNPKFSHDMFDKKFWVRFVGGQKTKDMRPYLKEKIEDHTPLPELTEDQERIADMLYRMVKVEELTNSTGNIDTIINALDLMRIHIIVNGDYYEIYDVYDNDSILKRYYINRIPENRTVDIDKEIKEFYRYILYILPYNIKSSRTGNETHDRLESIRIKGMVLLPHLNSLEISDEDKLKMIKDFYRENGM